MSDKYAGIERRRFKRVNVNFTVVYKVNSPLSVRLTVGDREIDAVALDISEGGMAVTTSYELPKATVVTIKFIIINESAIREGDRRRSIEVQGEVTNCVLIKEKGYRFGVQFMDMTADDRRFLVNFVRKVK